MKVKVLSMFFGYCPYKTIFLNNIQEYCDLWGYELLIDLEHQELEGNPFFNDRWFWWHNHTMIEIYLKQCDRLLWIDMDCIILNMKMRIEDFVFHNILMTKEEFPETGAMLFNNTKWTWWFLNEWGKTKNIYPNNDRHISHDNNYRTFIDTYHKYEPNITFSSNTDFMIKHVHIEKRKENTFIMHVPGSTMEDKVFYMDKYSKQIIR